MQNGLGLFRKIASSSATAVSVFSPPESSDDAPQLLARRAGGDLDAALQHVGPVFQDDVRLPAAEQLAEQLLEVAADRGERVGEQLAAVGVDRVDHVLERLAGGVRSSCWAFSAVVLGLDSAEFLERLHVHAAEPGELAPRSSISCWQFGAARSGRSEWPGLLNPRPLTR